MDIISKTSGFSHKTTEDYINLQEIMTEIEALRQDNFLQSQSLEVMEKYLKKKCPNVLLSIEKHFELSASNRSSLSTNQSVSISNSRESAYPGFIMHRPSNGSSPILTSRSILHSSFNAQRINIIYRVEMVDRELEECKMQMEKMRRRFDSAKFLLQTEEENLKTDVKLFQECTKALQFFIAENVDHKTGRILHDKFLRFLENELQSKDRDLRKMKLKTKTYQTEYNRIKSQQQQKLELRERLHPVDLDKLNIENAEQLQLYEQKSKQLLDLKRLVGKKGQSLVSMKSKLNDTILSLKNISQDIKQKEAKYESAEVKESQNINDLVTAEVLNQSIKKLTSTYRSPDVHNYLKIEVALGELKKEKEAWERRCKNQKQTITLLEHQLKQLAPSESRSRSITKSVRSVRSVFSVRSADSLFRQSLVRHCTPASPL